MSTWIESHQALSRHHKTLRAVSILKIDRHKLIGHLHELWWWGLDNVPADGWLNSLSDDEIAAGAQWDGDGAAFTQCLIQVGFIDVDSDGGKWLHDWYEYAGKLLDRRAANATRMREARAPHVHRTCIPPCSARAPATVPNRTVPNHKKETAAKSRPITPPEDLQEFDAILRAVPAYSPTENYYQQVCKFRPTVDLCLEANKMVGWIKGQSKTKGTTAFVLSWLERANNEKHIPKSEPVPWVGKVYVQGN